MSGQIDDVLEQLVVGDETLEKQAPHIGRPQVDDMPRPVIVLIENTKHLLPIDLIFRAPFADRFCAWYVVVVRRPFHLWFLGAFDSRIGIST